MWKSATTVYSCLKIFNLKFYLWERSDLYHIVCNSNKYLWPKFFQIRMTIIIKTRFLWSRYSKMCRYWYGFRRCRRSQKACVVSVLKLVYSWSSAMRAPKQYTTRGITRERNRAVRRKSNQSSFRSSCASSTAGSVESLLELEGICAAEHFLEYK